MMKHLLSLLGSMTMIGTVGATVVSCGNKTENKKDTEPKIIDIKTIIKNTDLGVVEIPEGAKSHDVLLAKINEINKVNLKIQEEVRFGTFGERKGVQFGTLEGVGKYNGSVEFTFSFSK